MTPAAWAFAGVAGVMLLAFVFREAASRRREQQALNEIARAFEAAEAKDKAARAAQAKVTQAVQEVSDATPEELERRARDLAARGRMPQ